MSAALLAVRDLTIDIDAPQARGRAVDGVSFELRAGQTLALLGESGCGKTLTALALMELLPEAARRTSGEITSSIAGAAPLYSVRGDRIAMVFQEPMTALNPVLSVGDQVAEPLVVHRGASWRDARRVAQQCMEEVGLPASEQLLGCYPHQLSGGMRQRVLLAMALVCEPEVLIADEPTTAVDVTLQAQIALLLRRLQRERHMAMLFITHDIGLVRTVADEVAVMYAGRIVEQAPVEQLLARPRHPYTRGLLLSTPALAPRQGRLHAIGGVVPPLGPSRPGCAFRERCPRAIERCAGEAPPLVREVACFAPHGEPHGGAEASA